MAGETGDNSVEGTKPVEETPTTIPMVQYQDLQRKYAKLEKRNKALAAAQVQNAPQVDRLDKRFDDLLDVLGKSPIMEEQRATLSTLKQSAAQERDWDQNVTKAQGRMAELLEGYEGDWNSDELFEEAREAWHAGHLDEAIMLTRQVRTVQDPSTNIEAIVEKKVSARLQELGHVDQGASTANTSRVLRKREDWATIQRGSPEETEAINAVLGALGAKKR